VSGGRRGRSIFSGPVAVGAVLAAVAFTGCGGGGDVAATTIAAAVASAGPASSPFSQLTEIRLADGDRCERIVVADDAVERARGLMGLTDLGQYDGMLFVFADDVGTAFTMYETEIALDIGWYTSAGAPVDRAEMVPCPEVDPADCPLTRASDRYRYALETPAGGLGAGALAGCT